MPFVNLKDPVLYCVMCRRKLDQVKVTKAFRMVGRSTIPCECGEIWGIDNYPPAVLQIPWKVQRHAGEEGVEIDGGTLIPE